MSEMSVFDLSSLSSAMPDEITFGDLSLEKLKLEEKLAELIAKRTTLERENEIATAEENKLEAIYKKKQVWSLRDK